MSYLEIARQALREARARPQTSISDASHCEISDRSEISPSTSEPIGPFASLDGEGPSVWSVIRLRACMAYNWSTFCVSDPRQPERCVHCGRVLSPEEQGNPYEPL